MSNRKYVYALYNKEEGGLYLKDRRVQVFWLKSVAKGESEKYRGTIVKQVKIIPCSNNRRDK